jgi:HEAT repeat protein
VAWPWFAARPELLQQWLSDPATAAAALRVLAAFPQVPARFLPSVAAIAMGDSKITRRLAEDLLTTNPGARPLAEQGLLDGKAELRIGAARRLTRIGDPEAVPALSAALRKEKREVVKAAMLSALNHLGADTSAYLNPTALQAEAVTGLKAAPPASLSWFLGLTLPVVHWADGTVVDPLILRWWAVLAVKMKDPDGSGLFDLYLSLLDSSDAAALSTFVLRAWIAQDTRHPDPEQSRAHAETVAPVRHRSAQEWVARARQQKDNRWLEYAENAAAVPVEQHYADAYREHQSQYLGSAAAEKGLLALTTKMPGIDLANAAADYFLSLIHI